MRVVLIGSGNVATHLGHALKKAKHDIVQVYSRSETTAKELSKALRCSYCTASGDISSAADLYVLSISDQGVKSFLKSFHVRNKIIVHTSGSVPLNVFGKKFKNFGVIYPLQTFSKDRKINFSEIPLLVEGNNPKTIVNINVVAASVSKFVFEMNSSDRKTVHLSAVIANNFTNHLFVLAEKVLEKRNIPFMLLGPLLHETVTKALLMSPKAAQTGPARRGDSQIIDEHLKMLKTDSSLQKIYKLLSESIERENGIRL